MVFCGQHAVDDAVAPRVSGALAAHYAPRTPLCLIDGVRLIEEAAVLAILRTRLEKEARKKAAKGAKTAA